MNKPIREDNRRRSIALGLLAVLGTLQGMAATTIQKPDATVGSGDEAWSYLVVEGESYETESNEGEGVGFMRVSDNDAVTSFLGQPVLGADTTASGKGALWTQTGFGQHIDKVTYKVQFAKAGTYYLYMRFTMYENGGNEVHYLNEDSFFVPPDFGKDPETDWPLSDRGGYAEGCCTGAGYLFIQEKGEEARTDRSLGDEAGRAYWEGNFHWNSVVSSQFLNPETQGEPNVHFKYEVTEEMVGKELEWTISYREGGTTIDLFLFSTRSDLKLAYSDDELDQLLLGLGGGDAPRLAVVRNGNRLTLSWPVAAAGYVLEAASSVVGAAWESVLDPVVVEGGQNTVSFEAAAGGRYFRLKKQG